MNNEYWKGREEINLNGFRVNFARTSLVNHLVSTRDSIELTSKWKCLCAMELITRKSSPCTSHSYGCDRDSWGICLLTLSWLFFGYTWYRYSRFFVLLCSVFLRSCPVLLGCRISCVCVQRNKEGETHRIGKEESFRVSLSLCGCSEQTDRLDIWLEQDRRRFILIEKERSKFLSSRSTVTTEVPLTEHVPVSFSSIDSVEWWRMSSTFERGETLWRQEWTQQWSEYRRHSADLEWRSRPKWPRQRRSKTFDRRNNWMAFAKMRLINRLFVKQKKN